MSETVLQGDRVGATRDEAAWCVLHTKSRQEKAVAECLQALGIEHFLPTVTRCKQYGHRRRTVEHPLFPSYVFMRGGHSERLAAYDTQRIATVIPVKDQVRLERELDQIRMAVESGVDVDPYPYLKVGNWVRVRSGPLQGLEGIVEDRREIQRLVLQVHVLNRAVSLEIDGHLLEPLD
jgi:transcription antitermination factor NusG